MPGFEEALIGRALSQAVKPIIEQTQQSLARKGYVRTDVNTALEKLFETHGAIPPAMATALQLPIGFLKGDVDRALNSPEGHVLIRFLIAVQFEFPGDLEEDLKTKAEKSLYNLIKIQTFDRYSRRTTRTVRPAVDMQELDFEHFRRYVSKLLESVVEICKDWASSLKRSLRDPSQGLKWAHSYIANFRLNSIEMYLDRICTLAEPPEIQFDKWYLSYLKSFDAHHVNIQVPDLLSRKMVPYDSLFVESGYIPVSESAKRLSNGTRISLQLLSESISKTVILGDPGGGKSTTSSILAHRALTHGSHVPFIITLKDAHITEIGFSVTDTINEVLRLKYQCSPTEGIIQNLLTEGRAFIVFDGLDELTNGTTRRAAAQTIDTFAQLYPTCRLLVTSRRVGYATGRLNPKIFDEFVIDGFLVDQVEEYTKKWFGIELPSTSQKTLQSTVDTFMEISNPISDLRSNPLMLAFICVLYRGRRAIPQKRPEIFRQCVDLLLQQWDRSRGIWDITVDLELVELALSYIAHAIITEQEYQDGVTDSDVYEIVSEPLLNEGVPDRKGVRELVSELLRLCRGRAWIFTDIALNENGDDLFRFTHASFLEYFAALHIHRAYRTTEEIAAVLIPKISDGKWEVLAQICVAMRLRNSVGGGTQILDCILNKAESLVAERRELSARNARALTSQLALVRERETEENRDVALMDFLLRASESAPISSGTFEKLVNISLDHFVTGRSMSISSIFNVDYRYVEASYEKAEKVLRNAIQEFARQQGSFRDFSAAKSWFAVHLGYVAGQPLAHLVDHNMMRETQRELLPVAESLLAGSTSPLGWNLHLQAGGNLEIADGYSFSRIFDSCARPIPYFGPVSTASWIIDCFTTDIRPYLPVGVASRLLARFSRILYEGIFDNRCPDTSTARSVKHDSLLPASLLLAGRSQEVQAGWIALLMGVHEIWELDERKTRSAVLAATEVDKLLHREIRRGNPCSSFIESWICGDIDIWYREGSVSA